MSKKGKKMPEPRIVNTTNTSTDYDAPPSYAETIAEGRLGANSTTPSAPTYRDVLIIDARKRLLTTAVSRARADIVQIIKDCKTDIQKNQRAISLATINGWKLLLEKWTNRSEWETSIAQYQHNIAKLRHYATHAYPKLEEYDFILQNVDKLAKTAYTPTFHPRWIDGHTNTLKAEYDRAEVAIDAFLRKEYLSEYQIHLNAIRVR